MITLHYSKGLLMTKTLTKKYNQLKMHPSTASHKLLKDIFYSLICTTNQNTCHQCGEEMDRDTFSIEHKTPWLDSDNPIELYFDLDNISFSHLKCNVKAARKNKIIITEEDMIKTRKRYKQKHDSKLTKDEIKERRRKQYLRTGK